MRACVVAARRGAEAGAYPIGAAIVREGELLAIRGSSLPHDTDPSAHPELSALRAACADAGARYLPGAILYSTIEPCPMCVAAAIWARLEGIVFGVAQAEVVALAARSGGLSWRQIRLPARDVAAAGDPSPWVLGGVLRADCLELLGVGSPAM